MRDWIRVQTLLDTIEPLGAMGIKRQTLIEDVIALFPVGTTGRRLAERTLVAAKKEGHGTSRGMGHWLYAKKKQQRSEQGDRSRSYKYENYRSFVPGESFKPTYPKRKGNNVFYFWQVLNK